MSIIQIITRMVNGRKTPVGFFSMVKGHDVVFPLDKAMVETLSQNLFEQQEPEVPEE